MSNVDHAFDQVLEAQARSQAMACIGCNDCLLACPLPQAQHTTIAALNAAVHLPVITDPRVADFVNACTQCLQCVPACPADLSRADMVLYNKIKVEDKVPDYELFLQTRAYAMASGWTLDELASELTHLPLFFGTDVASLRRMLMKSTLRFLSAGEVLCHEGAFVERLYVVLEGAVTQSTHDAFGRHVPIVALRAGSFFGEMGVLADAPEPYAAHAGEDSIVLEVPKVAALRLMEQAPAFRAALDGLYRERALWSTLRNPGGLGALPEAAARQLLDAAELVLLSAGEVLFEQGSAPDALYLVRSGFVRAVQSSGAHERVLVYFREGDVFGVLDLLENQIGRGYTAAATSRTEVIRVPSTALMQLCSAYPEARDALGRAAFENERLARAPDVGWRPGSAAKAGAPPKATMLAMSFDVLVEQGLAAGREVLVIDQYRCTNCQNCVDACERRHGYSRLQLRGLQVDRYLFPTACRHCEDPACLLCSVNGIVRLPSGEIRIVEDNCIGCGACASRCPYGNISMHPIEKPKAGTWPSLLDFVFGGERRRQALAAIDPAAQRIAVKCDLCAGHGDYACVTACPVGAANRVDPNVAFAEAARPSQSPSAADGRAIPR